jgi:TonB-linked SusC/RagA family outer membrane protein
MKRSLLVLVIVMLFQSNVSAQELSLVNGTVTDANGMPIPGVSVIQQGTSNGTVTNFDGEFTIEVPGDAILEFNYLGYATLEYPVDGRETLAVQMTPEASSLDEVIVVGYGTQRKADLTGAVSVVDIESMNKQPSPQVSERLQGRVSGVTIASSGQPGEPPQVRIRGINTFGNSNPLYVIDGIPGDITSLNPNDIENMQVLKDAGSASIYGARAANGVIIITTKKGRGDLKVNYNGFYGTQRVPEGNVYDIASPQEHADLRWMAMQNTNPGETITDRQYGTGSQPTIPYYILPAGASEGAVDESTYFLDPYYTDGGVLGSFNQIIRANQEGTNWFQEIFNPAPITSHDISVSQGGEKGNVLFSLSWMDQEGTLINTYMERYTARVNSQFDFSENFRIGENLAVSLTDDNRINVMEGENPINYAYRMQPIIPVYDIAGNFAGTQAPSLGNSYNPVATLERNRNNVFKTNRIFGNVFAELDFLDVFTARTSFGGSYYNTNGHTFTYPEYENAENSTFNQLQKTAQNGYNWTWSNTLQYQQNFNDLHDVSVLIGSEAYHNQYEEMIGVTQGYYSFDPDYVNLSTGAGTQTNSGFYTEDALFSVFGRLDYTYDDKYLLGATIRRDATSRFQNPRHGWFPAVSAGWRISNEAFMQDVDWVSDLKLRGGYGLMGNQMNVDPANAFTTYGSSRFTSYYDMNGTNGTLVEGFERSRIGNPDAGWEKNVNANIGIDVALFQSKLQITADYYRKDVIDLLYNPELPGTAGVSTFPYVNIAEMKNSGFDLSATTWVDFSDDFRMNATLTLTTYDNEIVNIAEGVEYFDQEGRRFNGSSIVRNAVGNSVGQFFGYQIEGFWNSQEEVNTANNSAQGILGNPDAEYQQDIGVGRFRYADINGDGVITAEDRTFLGNPNPKFTGGLNLDFTYKNFDMNIFLYASYGNDIWNQVKWWHDFYSSFGGAKSTTALYDSWTPQNQNATAPIQETGGSFSTANVPNSYFVEDGSYLRAKNVQLGYTLEQNLTDRLGLDRLRLYVQATNLFTITDYSGVDPELTGSATAFGIDEGSYPSPRQFIAGINLSL